MTPLLAAGAAAYGVFLLYTALGLGWRGGGVGPRPARRDDGHAEGHPERGRTRRGRQVAEWLAQAGLDDVPPREFVAVSISLAVLGALGAFALFGGALSALTVGGFAGTFPAAGYRARRQQRRSLARESWPRMLEEIRVHASTLGRSVPQALFEVGRGAPVELRSAFTAAEREWLLSTDFDRTVQVLKARLADATADAALETLLVAHHVGGTDLDRRLAALVEDRVQDVQGRKDARAEQAGVRFARRFVLAVPIGMALAGLSIGSGRAAYQTALGQVIVVCGVGVVVACWVWAGRLLRLPEEQRVFDA